MTAVRIVRPTWTLMKRAVVQLPRVPTALILGLVPPLAQFLLFGSLFGNVPKQYPDFPVAHYFTYIAPALVLFVVIIGMASAGIAFVGDFQSGYFHKILLAPVSPWSIVVGRLLSDGVRIYLQAALLLCVALLFGVRIRTGLPGALLMLALGTLFAVFSVGLIVANVAIRTKDAESVQSMLPLFFITVFLTTAYLPKAAMGNSAIKALVGGNPAQVVLHAMQGLAFSGYHWDQVGGALAVTAAFAAVGVPLTLLNFRASTQR